MGWSSKWWPFFWEKKTSHILVGSCPPKVTRDISPWSPRDMDESWLRFVGRIFNTPFTVNLRPFIGKVSESPYLLMIVGSTLKGILELPIPSYTPRHSDIVHLFILVGKCRWIQHTLSVCDRYFREYFLYPSSFHHDIVFHFFQLKPV